MIHSNILKNFFIKQNCAKKECLFFSNQNNIQNNVVLINESEIFSLCYSNP